MILISGASGKTGKTILNAIHRFAEPVRALVHHDDQKQTLFALGAQEVLAGSLQDPVFLSSACQNIRAIYHICPNMHPAELPIAQAFLAAARSAQVQRFVYHSVLHPQIQDMPHHWNKLRVEELLFTSGMSFTILQPTAYMQNVLGYWDAITTQHRYPVPYPVETRLSMIDLADFAEAAARVLTETGHEQAIYELSGSESLTQAEIAAILSQELGFQVQAEQVPLSTWEKQARETGLNDYTRETLLKMFRYYELYGLPGNPNQLTWLLQRAPASFVTFVRRTIVPFQ
jgi:NAD(P)H dehydrogenase (quinone)